MIVQLILISFCILFYIHYKHYIRDKYIYTFYILLTLLFLYYRKQTTKPIFYANVDKNTVVTFQKQTTNNLYFAVTNNAKLQIMSNTDLTISGNTSIKYIFLLLHGIDRNMTGYFSMANNSIGKNKNTLVFSVKFPLKSEISNDDECYWSADYDWVGGKYSANNVKISSFEWLDAITQQLSSNFSCKNIILSGHSGGGQCLSRYSGCSILPELLSDAKITYIPIAGSTYLWLTGERPVSSSCNSANRYIYGLDNLYDYPAKITGQVIKQNILSRNIILLCGEADTQNGQLDQSCGANAQGTNRFERMTNYFKHLQSLNAKNVQSETFPGVRHSPVPCLQGKLVKNLFNS
jgi:hypothetical protein